MSMFKKRKQVNKGSLRTKEATEDNDGVVDDAPTTTNVIKSSISGPSKGLTQQSGQKRSADAAISGAVYESSREVVPQSYAGDATYVTEIDTATDRDARAVMERNLHYAVTDASKDNNEPNVYRGASAYKSFTDNGKNAAEKVSASKVTGTQGPMRAPAFLRSSCRFDYQPDICKDYKETGFCGYGDNCKFLHDRSDYKSGWQLEREWESNQKKKQKQLEDSVANFMKEPGDDDVGNDEEEEENYEIDEDEELPFACFICRDDFTNPVVSLCGHYFCMQCATDYHKQSSKCPVCDKQTYGVFNDAHKLKKKLKEAGKLGTGAVVCKPIVRRPQSQGSWSTVTE